ncbi:MAG: DUF167 domain-containing protein [archaeon]
MKVRVLARPERSLARIEAPSEFEKAKCDLVVSVKSPPVGGKANREICLLLEEKFGKRAVLVSGARGKLKIFEVL